MLLLIFVGLLVGIWQLLKWAERRVFANPYLAFTFPTDASLSPDVFMTDYNSEAGEEVTKSEADGPVPDGR